MTCLDVDECAVDNGLCQQICINQVGVTSVGVGSHVTCPQAGHAECGCEPGYRLASDGRSCADIDECEVPDICGAGAGDCLNTRGSYTCHCHPGYEDSGQTCVDTDECRDNPCGHGECLNSPGGYECFCQPGYSFDGAECFDLDECFIGNPCINGVCTNIDGGYSCDCDKGYYESEGVCLDVNEVILIVLCSFCHRHVSSATPSPTILAEPGLVSTLTGDSRANVPRVTKPLTTRAETSTSVRLTPVENTETASISRDLINARQVTTFYSDNIEMMMEYFSVTRALC